MYWYREKNPQTHQPSWYKMNKHVLNYLHYILTQSSESILHRMFDPMMRNPTKGDQAGYAMELMDKYELNLTLKEIKETDTSSLKKANY